ncbi:hypothetical protein J3R30DRAFT_3278101 [Lentinula aciculospora]|uniref:Zn(2)-C6 fungal-type domain-containing protein n=1 Tax=Lentinula aciculospora TaxID=153920 RepID=A0A9W9DYC1_9AGAR|nr:hypothetical protein J3R30DRAFT_3278101 [Lentinula aciculospora]
MANKPTFTDKGTLQRGKACLRCRKRKMRCDGNRPACQQCTHAKKPDGCEYDDGKGKTRTQLLRETIQRLEQRVHELEDPEYISPAVMLHDPHAHQSESSSSSYDSPGSTPVSISHSPYPSGSFLLPSHKPNLFTSTESTNSPSETWTHLPANIFSPHRHQCGLGIHMGHLRESLNLPPDEQRHPALMNSVYLWACFVSRPKPLSQHEEGFLSQALDGVRDGLRQGDKLLDIIQASCLLSLYFLANGRLVEGSFHASAVAALAVQCGLQTSVPGEGTYNPSSSRERLNLDYIRPNCKEGERILAFWQVYNLDRCWSVALRKPCVALDSEDPWTSIDCPWPQDITEYESGNVTVTGGFSTVKTFLQGDVSGGFSMQTLRAKASAIFSRADQLAASWRYRLSGDSYPEEFHALELTINRFIPTLIPIHQLNATMPEEKHTLIVVHTLIQVSVLMLYQRFAQDDPVTYDKCSAAVKACVAITKFVSEQDYDYLDPIIGSCWTTVAEWLICEIANIESWALPMTGADVRNDIATILYAMTSLNARFPVLGINYFHCVSRSLGSSSFCLGISVSKIQKRMAELSLTANVVLS